jgi:predicted nucleotidyltransferase
MTVHPIEQVLATLNAGGVRYLVAGGVAVVLHGHLRTTADLDLVVALDRDNALRTIESLRSLGFVPRAPVPAIQFADPAIRAGWIADKGLTVFSLWSERVPGLEVDLFVEAPFDFEPAWSRGVEVRLDTTSTRVVSLPDLIAMKRAAGRPQDLADVSALERLAPGGRGDAP